MVPDKAKLERAKPLVRKATISHGDKPRSSEERAMKVAGERNAIAWHIFLTYLYEDSE
jgi:hypothetical protein